MQCLEQGLGEATRLSDQTRQHRNRQSAAPRDDPFDRLVAEHQERVARLIYRLLGWRGEVEDIVQDVFLAAFKRFDGFREDSSDWTWLAAIAINRCRTHRRRKLVEFRWLRRAKPTQVSEVDADLERDETARRVRQAVAELPPRDREVIVLYYLEEWSVTEISRATGARAGAIDVRLHRARGKLRAILEQSPE
jgi:RNA polymerase sigma factor (sigma-70 family)